MIAPGFADHDPGPGIEGMGTGALRGAGRTRRAVTRGHARPRAAFHKASWRTVSWVRVTGWHANNRTRVLPRLNGQPEPGPYSRGHPVISRARRVSHAAPVNEGLVRNSAIGGADAAHPRNIRTAVEASAPPARLAPGRLRRLGHGRRPSPARRRGPAPAAPVTWPGMRPAECRRGDRRQSRQTSPPPRRCHRQNLVVNVQPAGQRNLTPAWPDSSAASAVRAIVTAAPGRRHISPNG